jgi:hypothetical protein
VLIERWREHYNTVRPHSSLGYRPPAPETVSQAGTLEIPLADFTGSIGNFDVTDVRSMSLRFRMDTGESIEIDNLRFVPAPGAAALLAMGRLAAARRRR